MTKLQKDTINSWIKSAEFDRATALDLFKLKRYGWSLFIFHLAIEKLLKSHLVKNDQEVIFTHKLVRLAKLAKIDCTKEQEVRLIEISEYNIEARYDIEKMKFNQKADNTYTTKWIKICENIFDWLRSRL